MHGHEKIIDMRKKGICPKIVFINDFEDSHAKFWHDPGREYKEQWAPDNPTVCTSETPLSGIDLRFCVGIRVSISSFSESRAKALFKKTVDAGAVCVAAAHVIEDKHGRITSGWTDIYHLEDIHG
jgi:hypothetical protein